MSIEIVIPARYGSTRLPGKPLIEIGGQSMLSRMVEIAFDAADSREDVSVLVATDDERIGAHCDTLDVDWVMTSPDCPSGTDRIREAVAGRDADFVINLQGDTPLTPPHYVTALIDAFTEDPDIEVVTPVTQLRWAELDALRESKKSTPFSGTCVIIDPEDLAVWFSKSIIPAIRKEDRSVEPSPIFKHVGMYGYGRDFLEEYATWEPSHYEQLEGLEQLRVLENGGTIQTVHVESPPHPIIGVDSPEDVARAEALLA